MDGGIGRIGGYPNLVNISPQYFAQVANSGPQMDG